MMMTNEACHVMAQGEILNPDKTDSPLLEAVLYGDKVSTAKLSKRLSCAIRHLPLRVKFGYEYDTQKALDAGIRTDPTLTLEGKIFLEGMLQAEKITEAFENYIEEYESC